jgi:hypothetical protein
MKEMRFAMMRINERECHKGIAIQNSETVAATSQQMKDAIQCTRSSEMASKESAHSQVTLNYNKRDNIRPLTDEWMNE